MKQTKFKEAVQNRDNCRSCFSRDLAMVLNLGEMPLAGGFLKGEEDILSEVKIPLKVHFCRNCGLLQILDVVDPDILFKNASQYSSSVIKSLSDHFRDYALFLKKNYLPHESQLLEFGCNDGVLLQCFRGKDAVKVYGIDSSLVYSEIARDKSLNITTGYFNQKNARKMKDQFGLMDVVTGSNVFAHVDDVHEILKAAKIVLKPEGVFVVEVHYLRDLIQGFQYDTIYHEHLCYYSVRSIKHLLESEGFKIIDVVRLPMHGGALRVIAARGDSVRVPQKTVAQLLDEEVHFVSEDALMDLGRRANSRKKELLELLDSLKEQGKSIVGYGAPGRGTILLNFCGIGKNYLDYIVDISPLRAGKLMPGVHIPIYFPEKSRQSPPDYFLVLAWNYADSIMKQEKDLRSKGVKFIIPLPEIKVIS